MSTELYAWLIGGLALGTAIAGRTPAAAAPPRLWPSVAGPAGLIVALLAVGIASGTLGRHLVQLAPPFLALMLTALGSPYGRAATLPILVFWAVLMLTIWRFLLGWTRGIGGTFTPLEIALTIAIAACCLAGLVGGARPTANLSRGRRVGAAVAFGILQLLAFRLSLR